MLMSQFAKDVGQSGNCVSKKLHHALDAAFDGRPVFMANSCVIDDW